MRIVPRLPYVSLVLGVLFLASSASAADAELSWTRLPGAETCASRADLQRGVRARLRRDPFGRADALVIEGVVERAPNGAFRARFFATQPGSAVRTRREFLGDDTSCSSLDEALVLAIALAIDPNDLNAPPGVALRPGVPAEAARPPASVAPEAPSRMHLSPSPNSSERKLPSQTPPRAHGELSAHATLLGNVLPRFSGGVGLEGRLRATRNVALTVGTLLQPEQRDGDYAFGLSSGAVGACFGAALGPRLDLDACGRVLAGGMHAVVYRLEPTEPGQRAWIGASLGGAARITLVGPFGLHVEAFGLASLARPRFFVTGTNVTVFEVPATGFGGTLGVFARL